MELVLIVLIGCVTIYKLKTNDLRIAAIKLRQAQKAYMKNRGNQELGQLVGEAGEHLDYILDDIDES